MTKASKTKILIVDDNPDMLAVLVDLLSESDCDITTAENGKKALSIMKNFKPDLVVTDVKMPEMDGLLLLKRMRQDPKLVHVPVILNSTNGDIYIHKFSVAVQTYVMANKSNRDELKGLVKSALYHKFQWK